MSITLLPDPDELRSRAVETTLDQFDFRKVHAALAAIGRNRGRDETGGPATIEELRDTARELLEKAWDDEEAPNCEYCHGGLRASRTDGCLTLQFVLEEAFFVAAVDILAESA